MNSIDKINTVAGLDYAVPLGLHTPTIAHARALAAEALALELSLKAECRM
jgi:hypothetical protein